MNMEKNIIMTIVLKAKVYEIDGERIVIMDELYLGAKPKFNNQLDRNYYFFLNKKLSRVYPLFLTALEQYRSLQADIQNMKGGEKKKTHKRKTKRTGFTIRNQTKGFNHLRRANFRETHEPFHRENGL